MKTVTNREIKNRLTDLDQAEDINVTSWEAGFLETMLKWSGNFTVRQRDYALEILEKYEY